MSIEQPVTQSAEAKLRLQKRKKRWWAKNKDRIRQTLRCDPKYRYVALKLRCKRNKVRFGISYKNFVEKLRGGCYYCGANIMKEIGCGMDRWNNDNRNYTARNLVAACSDCNRVKNDRLTGPEMVVAMSAVNKFRKSKKRK